MSWLKFDTATPEKPEVMALTVAMGWDDPDLTVGKLLKVWRWFDQHTVEGNAAGVTAALLDRLIGVTGFSAQMAKVGWLVIHEGGISLPNFDRHNGKTAKDRALTAKRVSEHKANAKANGQVTVAALPTALPREEKRREEGNTSSSLRSEEGERKRTPSRPESVSDQVWGDWLALRKAKKAPVTQTVIDQATKQAALAGIPLEGFLTLWCARGSQGLQADWLKPDEKARFSPPEPTKAEVDTNAYLASQKALEAELATPEAREKAKQAAAMLRTVIKRVA